MKSYQTFTVLAFAVTALWLSACGKTDPGGLSRNNLGALSSQMASNDTTVQSSTGFYCTATVSPTEVKSGKSGTITLTIFNKNGTVSVPQIGINNSSQTTFQINQTFYSSGNFSALLNVSDSNGDSGGCRYTVHVSP